MTEERRLLATGRPLEDIISDCHALRREAAARETENRHVCKCGGVGNCPDCPNKDR